MFSLTVIQFLIKSKIVHFRRCQMFFFPGGVSAFSCSKLSLLYRPFETSHSCLQSCIVGKRISQEMGQLPSIRTPSLYCHLVAVWCNCGGLAWCHSILFAMTFQKRGQMSKLGFSKYLPVCVSSRLYCHF